MSMSKGCRRILSIQQYKHLKPLPLAFVSGFWAFPAYYRSCPRVTRQHSLSYPSRVGEKIALKPTLSRKLAIPDASTVGDPPSRSKRGGGPGKYHTLSISKSAQSTGKTTSPEVSAPRALGGSPRVSRNNCVA